jgi:hypothetical protein
VDRNFDHGRIMDRLSVFGMDRVAERTAETGGLAAAGRTQTCRRCGSLGAWRAIAPVILATACQDSPVSNRTDTPAQVLSALVAADPGGIFHSVSVQLDRRNRVVLDYWESGGERLRVESDAEDTLHRLFLSRLRARREYAFEVRAVTAVGESGTGWRGTFTTGSLPSALSELHLAVTGQASFDLLLLEIGQPGGAHLPIIIDTQGHVVWHSLREGRATFGFTVFEDTLFALNTAQGLRVVSPRSQEESTTLTRARAAQRTGIEPFFIHHDVIATPAGTLLFLALDPAAVRDTIWWAEAVWEWNPRSDELVRRWTAHAFLDPASDRGPRSSPGDWLHANSLALGPRGNLLLSFFWLHEVLSISSDWARVEWRLGGPASTFRGVEAAMAAGQHTATEVATDRVLLFDNGLDRQEGRYSRALEIQLDRQQGTAEVVWEFRATPDIYAPIVSSARRLSNGNTVVNFGLAQGFAAEAGGPASGPIAFYEVTPSATVRWKMEVVRGIDLVYRATPLATIAGERWVCSANCSRP